MAMTRRITIAFVVTALILSLLLTVSTYQKGEFEYAIICAFISGVHLMSLIILIYLD